MFAQIKNRNINRGHIDRFMSMSHTGYVLEKSGLSEVDVFNRLISLAEQSEWNIQAMLLGLLQAVPEKEFRNWCRQFLISKIYNILPQYPRGGANDYSIYYASDDCVFVLSPRIVRNNEIVKPTSTIVLTPQGDIKIPEGNVWINEASITWHGFTAKWTNLLGIYTRKGDIFLPCLFDDVENSDYLPFGDLQYKGFKWRFSQKGLISQLDKGKIQYLADSVECKTVFSCDNGLFTLEIIGLNKDGFLHKGGISISVDESDDPLLVLSKEEKNKLREENKKELLGIISAIHHRYTKEELLQLAEHATVG